MRGTFEIMAEFKSHEIANWLDTTTPANARALFESGAQLEKENKALNEVAKAAKTFMDQANTTNRDVLRKAIAALQDARK